MMERQYEDSGIEWIGRIPEGWMMSAIKRLMQWISINPQLTEALLATGYRKNQRVFTIRQVQLIFEHLGEP